MTSSTGQPMNVAAKRSLTFQIGPVVCTNVVSITNLSDIYGWMDCIIGCDILIKLGTFALNMEYNFMEIGGDHLQLFTFDEYLEIEHPWYEPD